MQTGLLLFSLICTTILGGLLLLKAGRDSARIALGITILAITGWNFTILMMIHDPTVLHPDLLWGKLASTFGVFIPMGFLWFAKTFRNTKVLKGFKDHLFIFLTCIVALFTLPDNFLFTSELTLINGAIKRDAGFYTYIIIAYYFIYFSLAFYNLIKATKNTQNKIVKTQISYITFTFIIAGSIAFLTNMILPTLGIYNFNGQGPILSLFLALSLFYAATHNRLLDFKLLTQQSLAYIFTVSVTAFLIFYSIPYLSVNPTFKGTMVFLTILSFYPVHKAFYVIFNYLFFNKANNYKDILRKMKVEVEDGQDLNDIIKYTLDTIKSALNLKGVALLLRGNKNEFAPSYASGIAAQKLNNPYIIDWLSKNKNTFIRDEMLYNINRSGKSTALLVKNGNEYTSIAAIYVPIVHNGLLEAVLVFEDKINESTFKNQEIKEIQLVLEKFTYLFVSAAKYTQIQEDIQDKQKVKEYFHKGLFHEVNTPLTIAHNYIEMVKWSSQNQQELESLQNAQKYLRKSSHVIRNIIELNKIVSGDTRFSEKKCQIKDILKNVIDTKKIVLNCNKNILKEKIKCDKSQLIDAFSKILINLGNLVESENSGFNIDIIRTKENFNFRINTKADISAKSVIQSIKTPSYKLGKELNSKTSNERIEMAIAKAIIERHHGNLNFKNSNKETQITIKLPQFKEK